MSDKRKPLKKKKTHEKVLAAVVEAKPADDRKKPEQAAK
jgi:hypothetical protein